MMDPDPEVAQSRVKELQMSFDIEIHGDLNDYLGIQIHQEPNGTITMTQPQLIDSILKDLGLLDKSGKPHPNTTTKDLPSMVSRKITADTNGIPFTFPWNYRSVIGKLNYLEKSSRPDISFVVHQLARYSTKTRHSHGQAIKHLGRYLLGTRHQGIILHPTKPLDLVTYVDADFSGTWDPKYAKDDPDTARSRSGYIVFLANSPLFWSSKLQTIIALSTAESELIALSEATCFIQSITYLIDEIQDRKLITTSTPKIKCRIFEDNEAALEISRTPKIRPRTRHINVIYHHFRSEVYNERVKVEPIKTTENAADILTKQLDVTLFRKHRLKINGW
jgi:hypothetical protein